MIDAIGYLALAIGAPFALYVAGCNAGNTLAKVIRKDNDNG